MRDTCVKLFSRAGYDVDGVANADAALRWLETESSAPIVLSDIRMPGRMDGMVLLDEVRRRFPAADVVIMTGFGSIDGAVAAMKQGAVDYVTKPFNKDELLLTIRRVAKMRELRGRVESLEQGLETRYVFGEVVANSGPMKAVVETMVAASRSSASLLLTGESGTGKDYVARLIHFRSERAKAPFMPVNCASLPAELIESELFGHVRGAYTGAGETRHGLIRQADGGTLLLDEITEMPPPTQAKLLRVLQERVVRPVGGTAEIAVDFRLVASTNRPIDEALSSGYLREDLYYRIGVLHIHLPPLRERREDIVPLFRVVLQRAAQETEVEIGGVDDTAATLLQAYDWPGNVRELGNVAERCIAMGVRGNISADDLRRYVRPARGAGKSLLDDRSDGTLAAAERRAVEGAIATSGGNKAGAARILGIARKTLYEKLRRHGLDA